MCMRQNASAQQSKSFRKMACDLIVKRKLTTDTFIIAVDKFNSIPSPSMWDKAWARVLIRNFQKLPVYQDILNEHNKEVLKYEGGNKKL